MTDQPKYQLPTCAVPDCGKQRRAGWLCSGHLTRWKMFGDPFATFKIPHGQAELAHIRFYRQVAVNESRTFNGTHCVEWTGFLHKGYGQFQLRPGKPVRAHRWAYEREVSELGPSVVLDHLCRNTACVNVEHLEPVSQKENIRRGLWGLQNGMAEEGVA